MAQQKRTPKTSQRPNQKLDKSHAVRSQTLPPLTPRWMSQVIIEYIRKNYFKKNKKFGKLKFYFPIIQQLQQWFLGIHQSRERRNVPKGYLQLPEYRVAYLLYFAQLNAIRFLGMCRHLLDRPGANKLFENILNRGRLRILDVGSGPANSFWGWCYFLKEAFPEQVKKLDLEIHLIDKSAKILQDADTLLTSFQPHFRSLKVVKRRFDFQEGISSGAFDLIFLSFTLNELPTDPARWRLISNLLKSNLNKGLLFVLEPAQSNAAKRLEAIRDKVISQTPNIRLVSPCPHHGNCPLAVRSLRDFCRFSTQYDSNLSDAFQQIRGYLRAREKGKQKISGEKILNYCYTIFTNHPQSLSKSMTDRKLIISEPLHQSVKGDAYRICKPDHPKIIFSQKKLFRGDLI